MTVEDRLRSGTKYDGDCWLWTRTTTAKGYGQIWFEGKLWYVHRVSYKLYVCDPGRAQVDHTCFVHNCWNPEHLRLATHKQNEENREGANKNNSTGIRGVRRSRNGKFYVQVTHNRIVYNGGTFVNIEEAEKRALELRASLFTHDQQIGLR